jgi:hypothetical protein
VTVCDTLSGDDQIQETREEAISEWGGGGLVGGQKVNKTHVVFLGQS